MKGDEIAVIGVAGQFPGSQDIEGWWQNLLDGIDCVDAPTEGVREFDAELFGVDEAEALELDPQHRLFLEAAWRAFEDAGYEAGKLDLPVGVFASASANQYALFHLLAAGRQLPPYAAPDYLPARVAYRFGLTGPAMAVQAACSGSLVAVCMAAQNLLDFRCDFALAGGSNVSLPQYRYDPGLVSPDRRCRAFDARGEGAGFASGAGAVVLRRLADAEAAGDRIRAVLRGWAVTNDGANRAGFAVPGVDGQAAAVAEALAVAEVAPSDIGFVEAHGGGTSLGDAIEVAALRRVFDSTKTADGGPVLLGSVKTKTGHLDAAAGVAGLLEAILAVQHGEIPANLYFETPNPHIDFGPFVVPTKTQPWPGERERIAGVSSFGLGGTNAHVVVSQPPAQPAGVRQPLPRRPFQRRRFWIDAPEGAG